MNLTIRKETPADYETVEALIRSAFEKAEHTDGKESQLVHKLREAPEFIAALSLVAEQENRIVGHILLTPILIEEEDGTTHHSLALAPVSVAPEFQKQGVGGKLIAFAHDTARQLGHKSIVLLGHPGYYPRFGYQKASTYKIKPPFDLPDEIFMATELVPGGLKGISGTVRYPKEFGLG